MYKIVVAKSSVMQRSLGTMEIMMTTQHARSAMGMRVMAGVVAVCAAMAVPFVHMVAFCGDLGLSSARGSEAIYDQSGELVGRVTSGGYGWRVGKSLALAMLKPSHSELGTQLKVKILGTVYEAEVVGESPFDPDNTVLRA